MQLEVLHQSAAADAKATPVLFVHGAWHGAWCWEETFMPYLAERGHNVYALSLRGHAGSEGDCQWAGIDDYIADVRQVAESISPHPVIVGHSMGGYITQMYMNCYEKEVPGAALVASIPTNGTLPFTTRLMLKYPADLLRALRNMNMHEIISTPQKARQHFFSPTMPQADVERYHAKLQKESMRIAILDGMFRPPVARRYDFPILVLAAVNDAIFTRQEQQQTARVYGTEAVFFNMAHDMMLEEGWEAVAEQLAAWLRQTVDGL